MNISLPYYVAFSHFLGIGPVKLDILIQRFGDIISGYKAPVSDIQALLGQKIASDFDSFRKSYSLQKISDDIQAKGIHIISREDSRYPDQFHHLYSSPICLYVKGDVSLYTFSQMQAVSIVGSRKTTSYGRSVSRIIGKELAENGWVVVSGMALGIDAAAHQGALDSGGKTIAVLGCGVNIIYPWENAFLYNAILDKHGLIISEFPPDMEVRKGYFVTRNRLISSLSQGTLVVEGAVNSGSLITARYALEQGKDVFACPGLITSVLSKGPHNLIQQGAKLITCAQDILDEYSGTYRKSKQKDMNKLLGRDEYEIYTQLLNESLSIDMLCNALSKRSYEIMPLLSSLELKNIILRTEQGVYEVVS